MYGISQPSKNGKRRLLKEIKEGDHKTFVLGQYCVCVLQGQGYCSRQQHLEPFCFHPFNWKMSKNQVF